MTRQMYTGQDAPAVPAGGMQELAQQPLQQQQQAAVALSNCPISRGSTGKGWSYQDNQTVQQAVGTSPCIDFGVEFGYGNTVAETALPRLHLDFEKKNDCACEWSQCKGSK